MARIEFPIVVNSIEFDKDLTIRPPLFSGTPGDFVAIRPCADEYEDKTFLGILLGDVALSARVRFDAEKGELRVDKSFYNPGIFVPDLGKVIYGCESWWGRINTPEGLEKITDADINDVWYVQALKKITETDGAADAEETAE